MTSIQNTTLTERLVEEGLAALRASGAQATHQPVVVFVPVADVLGRVEGAVRIEAQRWPRLGASRVRFDYAGVLVVLDGIAPGGVSASVMGLAAPDAQPVVHALLEALAGLYGAFRA